MGKSYFSSGGAGGGAAPPAINPLTLLDGAVNQPTQLDAASEREPLGLMKRLEENLLD